MNKNLYGTFDDPVPSMCYLSHIDCQGKRLLTYSDKVELLPLTLLHGVPCEVCHHMVSRQASR